MYMLQCKRVHTEADTGFRLKGGGGGERSERR